MTDANARMKKRGISVETTIGCDMAGTVGGYDGTCLDHVRGGMAEWFQCPLDNGRRGWYGRCFIGRRTCRATDPNDQSRPL
jgi:hypothetical protein